MLECVLSWRIVGEVFLSRVVADVGSGDDGRADLGVFALYSALRVES